MNNFLDDLRNLETGDDSDNFQLIKVIRDAANNLGDNARRMLEVGILQDELVKLGFQFEPFCYDHDYNYIHAYLHKLSNRKGNQIVFFDDYISTWFGDYLYSSQTWQQDVLNKVKEIINHE